MDDADAYFEEWRVQVDVLRPPKNESWGARRVDLLDPFGNTIFVMGRQSRILPTEAEQSCIFTERRVPY